jgi:hypothetical protein
MFDLGSRVQRRLTKALRARGVKMRRAANPYAGETQLTVELTADGWQAGVDALAGHIAEAAAGRPLEFMPLRLPHGHVARLLSGPTQARWLEAPTPPFPAPTWRLDVLFRPI